MDVWLSGFAFRVKIRLMVFVINLVTITLIALFKDKLSSI